MRFIDLEAQQERIKPEIDRRIQEVLRHGQYINGPEVKELEDRLASYVGTEHGVACASGTDALLMALMANQIGPGDAVFTTPFTFIATAEVISLLGATPIFVDIDPCTFNLDPVKLESAIRALGEGDRSVHPMPQVHQAAALIPKAIIPVDLFGLPADYERINTIAKRLDLIVIQDAAQSFGAEYHGRKACSHADIGCTSFFPAKPLGCYGDGGMCFTDDGALAERLRSIRVHGMGGDKYNNIRIGINGRLDTLQAAVLLAKFQIFVEEVQLRQAVADRYAKLLENGPYATQSIPHGYRSAWAQYSLLSNDESHRSEVQAVLKKAGIPSAIYYPKPLHMQQAFAGLGYRGGDFPVSENLAGRIFSIPMHPYLKFEDQETIARVMVNGSKK